MKRRGAHVFFSVRKYSEISTQGLTVLTTFAIFPIEHENNSVCLKEGSTMNINKFTQNSLQAVQNCEKIAADNGNQELAQEHLLYALLTQDDSLILKLLEKMSIQGQLFINRVEQQIGKRPKVQGGQAYVGQDLNNVLIHAEDEAKQMGDEYVSVEHLFLALLKYASKDMKQLFREFGISREGFLHALSTVRGNQRVTSDNPEATYDTLNKYGQDLV